MGFEIGKGVWIRRVDTRDVESVLWAIVLPWGDKVPGLLCAYNSRVETYPGAVVTGTTTLNLPNAESELS